MRVFIRPPVHDNLSTLAATVTFLQFAGNRITELGASFNKKITTGWDRKDEKNDRERRPILCR